MELRVFLLTFLIGLIKASKDYSITCGSVIKLQNVYNNARLHSHDIKYGSGSGQQSVTGMDEASDVNSHWQILGRKFNLLNFKQFIKFF